MKTIAFLIVICLLIIGSVVKSIFGKGFSLTIEFEDEKKDEPNEGGNN